jgi:hypothetical protein
MLKRRNKMKGWLRFSWVIVMCLIFCGCAGSSKYMKPVLEESVKLPGYDETLVVFLRPSGMAWAIQSSVFDITSEDNKLVGIVPAKKKVAYKTSAGEHMFMVVGESADFMKAHLAAGKTYYALVTPRMGAWKARFSLKPVHEEQLSSEEFKKWVNGTTYVENTPASFDWARQNAASIQSKREKYIEKWNGKSDGDKPVLDLDDGS